MGIKEVNHKELERLRKYSIGQRLKWIREQLQELYGKGYSINQVGKTIKVISAQGLSAIENGKTANPTSKTIKALAEYYRVPSDVFFDEYYEFKNKPFQLGDVPLIENDLFVSKPHTYDCRVNIIGGSFIFNETVKLSTNQLETLVKRIKFEITLLRGDE
jgi:transcriptional regulator with XRE-family HTH domain